MTARGFFIAACACAVMAMPLAARAKACADAPDPVITLDYGSRYQDDSATRSEIDPKGDAEADEALKPIDDFLRDLTTTANKVFKSGIDKAKVSDCVIGQIATWASAGAMTDLQSETANLTMGARIAGFALILRQVLPHTTRDGDADAIKAWLAGLMRAHTSFWEAEAPQKARFGNLRAWSALAAAASAEILDDTALRAWATWSVSYVLCSADADGSLPQEMSRGAFALKYQLHAIAPLVVASLLLERTGVPIQPLCDGALARVIGFAVADLDSGQATEAITGKQQSFFDGSDKLEAFHLAWLEAYLLIDQGADRAGLEDLARKYRPLSYSKLGGDQAAIWKAAP